jgi:epoxyqueuosine reductase
MFAGSPVKRIGRGRFLRNVLIAIGNSGDGALLPAVAERLDDADELVRGAAIWALGRLAGSERVGEFALPRLSGEPCAEVREEWRAALAEG